MGRLIKFRYLETEYIVQSFLKNDFTNICELNGDSFHIDFKNNTISTSGKETKIWNEKKSQISINEIKNILNNLFK